jgi:hypothetical protein
MPHGSAHAELFDQFVEPMREFSPVVGWWWTAEPVELARLTWQLDELAEHGVHNVLPINLAPVGPLHGALADDPPLFSDEWWELWRGMCEHARRIGTGIWFYDQIGFGGSNVQGTLVTADPEFTGASLDRVVSDTDGPCELAVPAGCTPVGACALPLDDDGCVSGPPVVLDVVDGRVSWAAAPAGETRIARHRVMIAYSRREGFDYTSPRACERLIDVIHGEFERRLGQYFGDVIVGSFQDEMPSLPTWSSIFADEFVHRCGYRLEPVIACLWEDWGLESARVRVDFQRVRAALVEEAFFRPLFDWHEKRGMTCGFDQQSHSRAGDPAAAVTQYADYLRTHRWYSAPGSDHWGSGKVHSSLAHHYARPRTWIESFHSTGWGGTLEETFDWLMPWLLAGANLYCPHAVYYSTHGAWWEWAPPSTCWRQPYWRHYRMFADTVARLCWLLTRGEHACDVGVLFPTTTMQATTLLTGRLPSAGSAQDSYFGLVGHMLWYYSADGDVTLAGHDFDVLDDDTVASASVQDGALRTSAESYRTVLVPGCRVLAPSTAASLVSFCESGGLLVFVGDLPEHASHESGDQDIHRLREMVADGRARHVSESAEIATVLDSINVNVHAEGRTLRRRIGDAHVLLVPAAPTGSAVTQPMLPWVGEHFTVGAEPRPLLEGYFADLREHGYEFVPERYRKSTTVRIEGSPGDIEQWDPSTGTARPAYARTVDGGVDVEVDFGGAPAAVLVWRDRGSRAAVDTADQAASWEEKALDGPWEMSIVATMDNHYGDFAWPPSNGPLPVQQWRLRHAVEPVGSSLDWEWLCGDLDDSIWDDVLVGYGAWAWRLGPLDPADVPETLPPGYRGELAGPDWEPVVFSLSRGIEKDPVHVRALGPKARVPEDFWHVDGVNAGQLVVLRTSLPVSLDQELTLAVCANGLAEVWWNGVKLATDSKGLLRLDSVRARAGANLLEVRVTAHQDGPLRGYWALTTDPDGFVRPSWLIPGDRPTPGSEVRSRTSIWLDDEPAKATLQLGTEGAARLSVNGEEVASQGTFDPYGSQLRVIPYDVTKQLRVGMNVVEVVLADAGAPLSVFMDGVIEEVGGRRTVVITDDSWSLTRNGVSVPFALGRRHPYDPRWELLRGRPHPLPRAAWLDDARTGMDGGVLDIAPDARPDGPRPAEWFRVVVPPGATRAHFPMEGGSARVWLDGTELPMTAAAADLPDPERERRVLAMRIEPDSGHTAGALWSGPLLFEMGPGRLRPGDWAEAGLGSFAGGVRYRRVVQIGDGVERAILDLGSVRGTAEVAVNGDVVASRIWSPYRVELTGHLRPGRNELEVTVFNTLAPYVDDVSPTQMVFPGQRVSGLLGPVHLVTRVT